MRSFLKVWLGIAFVAIGLGIVILLLAVANGASWRDNAETYSMNESYDGVRNINFDIGFGKVKIEEGDTFSIDADNMADGFESYVTDGTWYIRENYDSMVNIFGWKFSLRQLIRWDDNYSPKITITVPKDFAADSYILNIGAGEVDADTIYAADGDFSVDAGRLKIDHLVVSERSTYDVGTGEMVLNDFNANDTSIKCGVGNIEISGAITGDNDITCGIGRIKLDLNGEEDDYSYEISSGIGNVVIDNRSYHNVDKSINNGSGNDLKLNCGIGNITVEFN